MSHEALLAFIKAVPFRPFRITMNSGRTFDIRHPEMIRVTRREAVIFTPVEGEEDVYERWHSIGFTVIENVTHLDNPVSAAAQGAA